jgi:hypothetical protein
MNALNYTSFLARAPIIICSDARNPENKKKQIGKDILEKDLDVAFTPIFSQKNLEGEAMTYQVVLTKNGIIYVTRKASDKPDY